MNNRLFFGVLFLWLMSFAGCDIINPPEKIPAYVYIQPFTYTPALGDQSTSFKITEAWVYLGGELLGAFHLPGLVPVLAEGDQQLSVFPGILDNGLTGYPNLYNFYKKYDVTLNLVPTEIDTIYPATHYEDYVKFALKNDFEDGLYFDKDLDSDEETNISPTYDPAEVFEGNVAGKTVLTTEHPFLHVTTTNYYDLPVNGTPIYFEMNYKSDVELTIGLQGKDEGSGETASSYPVILFPKQEWNKIYINLTEEIQNSDLDLYRVILFANLPDSIPTGTLLFDNLKIVHQ